MKCLLAAVLIWGLVPARAQRITGHAVAPGSARRGSPNGGRRSSGGGFGYGLPFFYDGYDSGAYGGVVYVAPPPAAAPAPVNPPAPPQPVVHDYTKPGAPEPVGGTAAEFSIVGADGSVRLAIAAWVQGDVLYYVDPENSHWQMPLGAVNRSSTRRANAEKGLTLQLPAPAASPTL
jgi:hypothetical protein